jgi:hypothetical protein
VTTFQHALLSGYVGNAHPRGFAAAHREIACPERICEFLKRSEFSTVGHNSDREGQQAKRFNRSATKVTGRETARVSRGGEAGGLLELRPGIRSRPLRRSR